MSEDIEIKIVSEKHGNLFEKTINSILKEGCWRIANSEMSTTDHHYIALLIRSKEKQAPRHDT